jgi:uncharacterized lipoprotein YddW (UPF0748 family)
MNDVRRARHTSSLAFAIVLSVFCVRSHADERPPHTISITATTLSSLEEVRHVVSTAVAQSADTIVLAVSPYAIGDLPFDGTAALIRAAHDRSLRVRARVIANVVAGVDELPTSREHVVYQHPEWLMVPRDIAPEMLRIDQRSPGYVGRLSRWVRANASHVSGLYLSPLSPAAAEYAARAIEDLVRRYAFDGLDIRAVPCADDFDYSRNAMDVFRTDLRTRLTSSDLDRMGQVEALDPFAYADEYPEEWRQFERARLDELVNRVSVSARAIRPSLLLAADEAATAPDAH